MHQNASEFHYMDAWEWSAAVSLAWDTEFVIGSWKDMRNVFFVFSTIGFMN